MVPPIKLPGGRKAGALAIAAIIVAGAEGLRQQAYLDPVGIPTICFGETRGVALGDTATVEQCRTMLANRLDGFSTEVDRCLKAQVPAESYAAFLSFSYNAGSGNFCRSTMVRKANGGDLRGACDELLKWDKARDQGGKVIILPGLTKRRQDERALCLKGADIREAL